MISSERVDKQDIQELSDLVNKLHKAHNPKLLKTFSLIIKLIAYLVILIIVMFLYKTVFIRFIPIYSDESIVILRITMIIMIIQKLMLSDLPKFISTQVKLDDIKSYVYEKYDSKINLNIINDTVYTNDYSEYLSYDNIVTYYVKNRNLLISKISSLELTYKIKNTWFDGIYKRVLDCYKNSVVISNDTYVTIKKLLELISEEPEIHITVESKIASKTFVFNGENLRQLLNTVDSKIPHVNRNNNNTENKYRHTYKQEYSRNINWEDFFRRYYYREYTSDQRAKSNPNSSYNNNPELNKALKLFNLTLPFTELQLKKRRNELLKKYHPDECNNPNNTELSSQINTTYTYLLDYANKG